MKIGIFWPNWIGDAIMATPAVRAIRTHFPQALLIGFLRRYISGVIEGNPWLDEAIHLESKGFAGLDWARVGWRVRGERLDAAILFPNSFRSALVAWIGRCRRRVGFARYGRGLLLTDSFRSPRDALGRRVPSPVLLDYNRLAKSLGCRDPGTRLELFTTAADEALTDRVWEESRFHRNPFVACLNPGAAFGPAKCWPVEFFAELARDLSERRQAGILVLCGPAEKEMAQRIVSLGKCPGMVSLTSYPLSLGLTKACIRRADILVTTDSGPRHMAAAFNRPVVTIFGPTHISWTETFYSKAMHLQKNVPCGPCQRRICPLDHRCMTQLKPAEVARAVEDLLERCCRRTAEVGANQ
jgi:heptosyltransferase-2